MHGGPSSACSASSRTRVSPLSAAFSRASSPPLSPSAATSAAGVALRRMGQHVSVTSTGECENARCLWLHAVLHGGQVHQLRNESQRQATCE